MSWLNLGLQHAVERWCLAHPFFMQQCAPLYHKTVLLHIKGLPPMSFYWTSRLIYVEFSDPDVADLNISGELSDFLIWLHDPYSQHHRLHLTGNLVVAQTLSESLSLVDISLEALIRVFFPKPLADLCIRFTDLPLARSYRAYMTPERLTYWSQQIISSIQPFFKQHSDSL